MKQAAIKSTVDMLHKIELIEKEVKSLKLSLIKKLSSNGNKVVKLKGIIKGVDITAKDIASAKKSLYGRIGI